jgi:hypothetical protein
VIHDSGVERAVNHAWNTCLLSSLCDPLRETWRDNSIQGCVGGSVLAWSGGIDLVAEYVVGTHEGTMDDDLLAEHRRHDIEMAPE